MRQIRRIVATVLQRAKDTELGATIDQPITERPGSRIGPFKLREQIGEGGMGVVYVAQQYEPVRRKVALKIIKPGMDSRAVVSRFEAERQALALMDHPNIAKVYDAGATEGGRPYFVMELVPGLPITEFCDQRCLTTRARLELLVTVCQTVQHAHQKGIIHRDLKPSNILVTMHDEVPVPMVIDFGVARSIQQPLTEHTVTGFGQLIGTPTYMSPEQAELNALDVDTGSDIYSLGVLLYELLTGTTPFDQQAARQAGFDEVRRLIREVDPPRPSQRVTTLGAEALSTVSQRRGLDHRQLSRLLRGELDWIVMKALEKNRNRRYETATGLAHDIQRYLHDEPVAACPPSAVYRFRKFARRNKVGLFAATLILFVLVLLGISIGWTLRDRWTRQARVSEQVTLILDEVERLEQEQKWPEALTAAKRAKAALAGGEATDDVQARVRQMVTDLELVARLEEIRLLQSEEPIGTHFDDATANRRYAAALRDYAVDVDALPSAEAAERLRSRPGVLPALIAALDESALCRRRAGSGR